MSALSMELRPEGGVEDRTEKKETIKVVDRRSFTANGQRREPDVPADAEPAKELAMENPPGASAKSQPPPATPAPGPIHGEGFTVESPPESGATAPEEEALFVNLVVSIYQSGLIHLGLVNEEGKPTAPADFDAARGAIEMLMMLRGKTRGNLSSEESRILDSLLAELQMAYAMKVAGS